MCGCVGVRVWVCGCKSESESVRVSVRVLVCVCVCVCSHTMSVFILLNVNNDKTVANVVQEQNVYSISCIFHSLHSSFITTSFNVVVT